MASLVFIISSNSNILRKLSKKEDANSLEFHLYRGDFENWISEILGDKELAEEISELRKLNLKGKNLQDQLHFTISKRYYNLKNGQKDHINSNNNERYEEMEKIVDKLVNHLGKMEKNIKKITEITELLHISKY